MEAFVRRHGSWVVVALCAVSIGGCQSSPLGGTGTQRAPLTGVVLSPEIATDTPVLTQRDLGHDPDIAATGDGRFLVTFEDVSRIRAVRVDGTGRVLDLQWIDLGVAGVQQYGPSVAFGGGHALVTWWQLDASSALRVHGRFVAPDGTPEGTESFAISSGDGLDPAVAWNGQRFVVTWLALTENGNDIHVALVDGTGVVAGSERAVSMSGSTSAPRVVAGTTQSVVAWEDRGSGASLIRAARVDAAGAVRDPGGILLSTGSAADDDQVKLAAGGTSFLAVWRRRGTPSAIRGALLRDDGVVTAADTSVSTASEVNVAQPSASFDGAAYLVAWEKEVAGELENVRSVAGKRVSSTGVVSGLPEVALANGVPRSLFGSDETALAWNGAHFLLAFLGNGIEGSLIAPDLTLAQPALGFSGVPNSQGAPQLAWNGSDYVVAWTDERDPGFENATVRAVRVSTAGQVRDPDGLPLSGDKKAFALQVASTGQTGATAITVLLWFELGGASWQRTLASNGTAGPITALTPFLQSSPPSIATDGAGYLAVFSGSSDSEGVVGALLNAAGSPGETFPIHASSERGSAAVVATGQDYLVSYREGGMYVVPVSRTGQVGTPEQVSEGQSFVSAATDGTDGLVVWVDVTDTQVRARFRSGGAWRGDTVVVSDSSLGYPAAVVWDGARYRVAWEAADRSTLQWRSVAPDGTWTAPETLVVGECNAPTFASNRQGQMLLSCYRYHNNFQSRRIVSWLIGPPTSSPDGGAAGSGGAGGAVATGGADGGVPATGGASGTGGASSTGGAGSGGSVATTGGSNGSAGNNGTGGNGLPPFLQCSIEGPSSPGVGWGHGVAMAFALAAATRRRRRDHRP